jgi:hypothetical protein
MNARVGKVSRLRLWFGAPPANLLETALNNRFPNAADSVEFVDAMLDRQITKAGGLLTFNSILLAGFRLSTDHVPHFVRVTNSVGSLVALATCLVLLVSIVRVTWSQPGTYGSATSELTHTVRLLCQRSYVINVFAMFSAIGAGGSILEFAFVLCSP